MRGRMTGEGDRGVVLSVERILSVLFFKTFHSNVVVCIINYFLLQNCDSDWPKVIPHWQKVLELLLL
jgi:hypothetical protein